MVGTIIATMWFTSAKVLFIKHDNFFLIIEWAAIRAAAGLPPRFDLMPETKSILFAGSDEGMKAQVADILDGIAAYSLSWVGDSGDLLLKILDKDIDLVIIDENLDGLSGSTLIKIIKKSRPKIPLIIISSGNSKEDLARVLEQGIYYFILKPINGQELKEAVASGLEQKGSGVGCRVSG